MKKYIFVVSLNYIKPISIIEQYLPEHITFLDKQYKNGIFLASGKKTPRTGGVILAMADTRLEIEELLLDDPFNVHKLAEYEVTQFEPSRLGHTFLNWVDDPVH